MSRAIILAIVVGVAAGGAFYAWHEWHRPAPASNRGGDVGAPAAPIHPELSRLDAGAPKPKILHPIAAEAGDRHELPALDHSDGYVSRVLLDLLGRKAITSFFRLEDFARHFVATVNNLAGDSATPDLWPVHQTPGRFDTETRDGELVISAKNAERYAPLVRVIEALDTRKAVAAYVRLYPLFQRAYEDLGAPDQYFNDRLIAVIDDLLAAPAVREPVPVKLVTAGASPPPSGSPRLYVYADPSLETRTAGQKLLLRMGNDNARRLKAKLAEARALLVTQPAR